jgi:hypothetical protein
MRKKINFFVLLLFLAGFLFSTKVGTLTEVLKPDNITVLGDELYVVEGATIYIYSLKDLSLIRKFGKAGDGPGELQALPAVPNKIAVSTDFILAEAPNKLVYFSKDGKFIKEKRKVNVLTIGFLPIGKNLVATKQVVGEDKTFYTCICIFDPDLKEIKELCRQEWIQQGLPPGKTVLDMVMDFTNYRVYDDKIFIEESDKGFLIEIFDSKGNKLYQIEKDYEKILVTGKDREEAVTRFKEDPYIKTQSTQFGGWNELKKLFSMDFPETFPAIQDIGISDDKIYVQTYKKKNGKEEYVVMDLKGKFIKKTYISAFEGTPMLARLMGAKAHTIANGKLYYLKDNIDEEEWDLYIEDIE